VDVRIVAATNRDLERAVADGLFREDLFFRLNVVSIQMPPLRERREEIPLLSDHFLKKYSVQYNKPQTRLSEETMALLAEYDWPGNVRELENMIKRVVVLGDDSSIRKDLNRSLALASERLAVSSGSVARFPGPAARSAPPTPGANGHGKGNGSGTEDDGNYSLKDVSRTAARKAERELILKMLQQTRWNRKETAEILGISYKALLYKIKENGLDKAS
jgi:two-component system response regulator AtoC